MKLVWLYYKEIHNFNLPFSMFMGLLGLTAVDGFYQSFGLSYMTGGFLLSLYFYEKRNKARYYFYFNRGFSRPRLIAYAYAINIVLLLAYLIIKIYR
jgi:hypothetical protein